jgi:hypothetical protein
VKTSQTLGLIIIAMCVTLAATPMSAQNDDPPPVPTVEVPAPQPIAPTPSADPPVAQPTNPIGSTLEEILGPLPNLNCNVSSPGGVITVLQCEEQERQPEPSE